MNGDIYDEDYFLRGETSGKSLYTDYRWLPDLTVPMARSIVDYLGISYDHTILDFGCARGYFVKALRHLRYKSYGIDISQWAIDNADEEVKKYVRLGKQVTSSFDWVIAKDVLEHVEDVEIVTQSMLHHARVGIFVVVPTSPKDGAPYVLEDYERDITHIHRLTLSSWVGLFLARGWDVTATYRVPGIKDNHYQPAWEPGDGFLICRRTKH